MSRPLRILMTVDAVGGVWRYALELTRALRPLGIETVLAGFGPEPTPAQLAEARAIGEVVWTGQLLDWMVDEPSHLAGVPGELERLAERHGVDLLHLNLPSQAAGLERPLPTVVVTHSCMPTWWRAMRKEQMPADWQWRQRLNRVGFLRASKVVAPSAAHADLTTNTYDLRTHVAVVHNGMSGTFEGGVKQPVILAAGRWWDEGKNARLLDEAALGLKWPVLMAGGLRGPDGQCVEIRHGQAVGAIDHADLLQRMRSASIVVSPSLYEPFGLAALEGARAGAALALSDIPTYRELWDDAAVFFDPKDAAGARAALSRLVVDHDLRADLSARALKRSHEFGADRQARKMAGIYRDAVSASPPLAMTGT